MTTEQRNALLKANWTNEILDRVSFFLKENEYTLYNLAHLGSGEYRVMFRDKSGKVSARLFSY